jgi:hypothetical protein
VLHCRLRRMRSCCRDSLLRHQHSKHPCHCEPFALQHMHVHEAMVLQCTTCRIPGCDLRGAAEAPCSGNSTTKNHATVNHSRFNICLHMRPPFSNALPAALQAVIYEELLQRHPVQATAQRKIMPL